LQTSKSLTTPLKEQYGKKEAKAVMCLSQIVYLEVLQKELPKAILPFSRYCFTLQQFILENNLQQQFHIISYLLHIR
jgi:hypothetical protein